MKFEVSVGRFVAPSGTLTLQGFGIKTEKFKVRTLYLQQGHFGPKQTFVSGFESTYSALKDESAKYVHHEEKHEVSVDKFKANHNHFLAVYTDKQVTYQNQHRILLEFDEAKSVFGALLNSSPVCTRCFGPEN